MDLDLHYRTLIALGIAGLACLMTIWPENQAELSDARLARENTANLNSTWPNSVDPEVARAIARLGQAMDLGAATSEQKESPIERAAMQFLTSQGKPRQQQATINDNDNIGGQAPPQVRPVRIGSGQAQLPAISADGADLVIERHHTAAALRLMQGPDGSASATVLDRSGSSHIIRIEAADAVLIDGVPAVPGRAYPLPQQRPLRITVLGQLAIAVRPAALQTTIHETPRWPSPEAHN